ncbi:MAG: phosphatidate cytidylyltransferase [Phycisphaeraceae bacterium]
MLKYRLILGPIMIALLLGVLWLDEWASRENVARAGLAMLIVLWLPGIRFASRELERFFRIKGVPADHRVLFIAGAVGCVGVFAMAHGASPMLVPTLAVVVLMHAAVAKWLHKRIEATTPAIASSLLCFVYLGLMPGLLLTIRIEHTAWVLGAALLTTKACDIGAYFTGRAIGRHKLIPWLSPGKTWEGLVGGVALSAAVSLFTLKPLMDLHWAYALTVGALLAIVGQAGDLLASMFKRDAAVKDSGQSIPGFGGVLDVVDSPLLVAPIAYWLLAAAA